ncbi:MAG: hypothetical protein QOE41_1055, partial [Mycobacterium sp.]|nr:hypothetical protein [Mycobacterium sp.]
MKESATVCAVMSLAALLCPTVASAAANNGDTS